MAQKITPMRKQYLEMKEKCPDCLLFFRLGDFYEMFDEDARIASKVLDLTLTTRDRNKDIPQEEKVPMCGVPYHSSESYIARLVAKGYKVAICEQMEDPALAKGLVKRAVTRIITPGTVIESSMLQDDRNNYIASLYLKGKKAGLCFADVSTGTAHITELSADKIASAVITELCRYHPSEVLMNPGMLDCRELTGYIKKNMTCSVELVEEERYAPGLVAISLENQFGRNWDETTSIDKKGLVRFAMAALLEYLHTTQIKGVERLKTVISSMKQEDVISGRDGELAARITEHVNDTTEFRDYGIEVLAIETKQIDLPDENKSAVYERMISERENIAASYAAEGAAQAKEIRNDADKSVEITISAAKAQAEKLKAEGEAEYMRILSAAYDTQEKADFYEFVRALDMARSSLTGKNKTLVVGSDSPIAQIFDGSWRSAE